MTELVDKFGLINEIAITSILNDKENRIKEAYRRCLDDMKSWLKMEDDNVDVVTIFEKALKDRDFFKKAWLDDEYAKDALIEALRDTYHAYKKHYIRIELRA